MRRRLEKRVYIALPESAARAEILKIHLGNTDNSLTPQDFLELGEMADGYSGTYVYVYV